MGVMGPVAVEPDQPIGKLVIKGRHVLEEQVFVVVHEVFLDGAVEALGVGIHLRGLRVGMPMDNPLGLQRLREHPLELTAIVRQRHGDGGGKDDTDEGKETPCRLAPVRDRAEGETETAVDIGHGQHVAPHAIFEALHRIERNEMAGETGRKTLGLAGSLHAAPGLGSSLGIETHRRPAQAIRRIVDDPPDRAFGGTRQHRSLTEIMEERIKLALAKVGMRLS